MGPPKNDDVAHTNPSQQLVVLKSGMTANPGPQSVQGTEADLAMMPWTLLDTRHSGMSRPESCADPIRPESCADPISGNIQGANTKKWPAYGGETLMEMGFLWWIMKNYHDDVIQP